MLLGAGLASYCDTLLVTGGVGRSGVLKVKYLRKVNK
jgi:hypothetical protein